MKFVIVLALIAAISIVVLIKTGQDNAMDSCVQTHSKDVCFQLLNR